MKDVVTIFLDLAKRSSPSKNEREVADYIKDYLSEYPSLTVIEDDSGVKIGGNTGNLIVTLPGSGPHVLFDAHMDTVAPCERIQPLIQEGMIVSDGSSILGADDKSGIALMLALIDHLMRSDAHPPVTFLFTICEEESLQGAKSIDQHYLKSVDYAFVLDGEGPIGTVVVKTPYGCKGTLKVIGKEAHAGACPEEGINALAVAAEAITALPIGRIDEETTCNIGTVQGGSATNVVMGEVTMQFEARSFRPEALEQVRKRVEETFMASCLKYGATFKERLRLGTPGYHVDGKKKILNCFRKACEARKITYKETACGGGSNANVYRQRGLEAVTLSTNMQHIHSVKETISIADLKEMLTLLKQLLQEIE